MRIPIADIFPTEHGTNDARLLVVDTTQNPPLPVPIRLGDANQDGFPDLLAIMAVGHSRSPAMAYSVPCAKGIAGCDSKGRGRRGFLVLTKGGEILNGITDARSAAFIDMDEDVSPLFQFYLSQWLMSYLGYL